MEKAPAKLIDEALAKAGGYERLVDRIAYEARTLKRVRSGELPMSGKLRGLLVKFLLTKTEERPSVYGKSNVEPYLKKGRRVPIYSFVQAGHATDYEDLPADGEDTVEYDGDDRNAFALRVAGDSMSPNFPPGTIITVSPSYPPHNGQLVVAKIKEEGVLFKIFHHSGDGRIVTLTSYNQAHPEIKLEREKFHWIYRVVAATQRFA